MCDRQCTPYSKDRFSFGGYYCTCLRLGFLALVFSLLPLSSLNTFKIRLFHDSVGNAIFLSSFLMRGAQREGDRTTHHDAAPCCLMDSPLFRVRAVKFPAHFTVSPCRGGYIQSCGESLQNFLLGRTHPGIGGMLQASSGRSGKQSRNTLHRIWGR